MTNNWTDMANATLVVVMGANPVENHPASLAHINKARAGESGHPKAKLIVIDPRKTRTAAQADRYVRIRPGTDIAFINGLMNYIITNISGDKETNWKAYHNRTKNRSFRDTSGNLTYFADRSWYTDARQKVDSSGNDYIRADQSGNDVSGNPGGLVVSLTTVATNFDDAGTVFSKLAEQVAPYTTSVVAEICGCTEADIIYVANAYMDNARFASYDPASPTTVINDTKSQYYRATTMLYAMGLTQHTYGSQNVKSFATLQILLGNMGRPGGGINALRGIHNVQGSTDMGLLYHLIPGYSANPSLQPVLPDDSTNAFGQYMNKLWGNRVSGGASPYDNAYTYTAFKTSLQSAGFLNMTCDFFGDVRDAGTGNVTRAEMDRIYSLWPKSNGNNHITMFRNMQKPYHSGEPDASGNATTKGCVAWGQNPAVTEPNQKEVRKGLYDLNTLVVVDMFENETAACKRNATGVTYLFPACSHVEEAGSVTNSGRCLQWREKATDPRGDSRSDIELLMRFAKALNGAGAFSHISDAWEAGDTPDLSGNDVYDELYGTRYGASAWDPDDSTNNFEDISLADVEKWSVSAADPSLNTVYGSEAVTELVYQEMCKDTTAIKGGTLWIYTKAYDASGNTPKTGQGVTWKVRNRSKSRDNSDDDTSGGGHYLYKGWGYSWLVNRRVFYNSGDTPWDQTDWPQGPDQVQRLFVASNSGLIDYGAGSYRHIHGLGDLPDTLIGEAYPYPAAKLHVLTGRFPGHMEPYETPRADLAARWGRDTASASRAQWNCVKATTDVAGRDVDAADFPFVLTTIRCVEHFQGGPITRNNSYNVEAEPEPWIEINSIDAAAKGIVTGDLVNVITARSNSTSNQNDRTVEIGSGGPFASTFAQGFRARVGVGLASNQRVGQGVVAIPWHWGDKGLSTGSRANDLCIDAGDANTTIPEYKACLCNIEKL